MATYSKLADLLNTTADMTVLRNNSAQDDGQDTVAGVDWFTFNGVTVSNLYVSGNSYVGFGSNTEHLKVCRRDCKMWYLYRQEGLIGNTKFLKIRWRGYSAYNAATSNYALEWELFLFDDGGLFLNLVTVPTQSGYLGTFTLTCGSKTYSYTVELGTPVAYSFLPQDDGSFLVSAEEYPLARNRVPYGECEFTIDDVQSITSVKDSYISWNETVPEGTSVRVSASLTGDDYVECESGSPIPCIDVGTDLSDVVLRIKVEMTTDDVSISPSLTDLYVRVFDASDVNVLVLAFDYGTTTSVQRAVGDITVAYDGTGTLMGKGGPVAAFEHSFTPEGLNPKNNPHDPEHIAADISVNATLVRIHYTDVPSGAEHLEAAISVAANLISVDDI